MLTRGSAGHDRLRTAVAQAGLTTRDCRDLYSAIDAIRHDPPRLILLDEGGDPEACIDYLRTLQGEADAPVICLVAGKPEMGALYLESGAVDVVRSTMSDRELTARIKLRASQTEIGGPRLQAGSLVLDPVARSVSLSGAAIELSSREFDLLEFLMRSPGVVFTREQILNSVWSSDSRWQQAGTVTEHVYRVRRKLGRRAGHGIVTVRGKGYRFDPEAVAESAPHGATSPRDVVIDETLINPE